MSLPETVTRPSILGNSDWSLDASSAADKAGLAEVHRAFEWFLEDQIASKVPQMVRDELMLVVQEATTNVVRHAYPDRDAGPLCLLARVDRDLLEICVADRGCGVDPDQIPPPDFGRPSENGGYGFHLMRSLMSRLSWSVVDGFNVLRMEKSLLGSPATGSD